MKYNLYLISPHFKLLGDYGLVNEIYLKASHWRSEDTRSLQELPMDLPVGPGSDGQGLVPCTRVPKATRRIAVHFDQGALSSRTWKAADDDPWPKLI